MYLLLPILFASAGAIAGETAAVAESAAEDCAILAVVAREHHGFDKRESPPLRASGGYLPDCEWVDLGVKIGTVARNRQAKLVFSRPAVSGDTARVQSLVIQGTLSGSGWDCHLDRKDEVWTLRSCTRTRAL